MNTSVINCFIIIIVVLFVITYVSYQNITLGLHWVYVMCWLGTGHALLSIFSKTTNSEKLEKSSHVGTSQQFQLKMTPFGSKTSHKTENHS